MTIKSFVKVIILSSVAIVALSLLASAKTQAVKADFVNQWGCTEYSDGRNSCHPDSTPTPTHNPCEIVNGQNPCHPETPAPTATPNPCAIVNGQNPCHPVVTPTPTPTPSATPTPTPTPTATPSVVQCPVGKIQQIVDSTVVCVSQNQENNQTQNNNQNQTQVQGSTTSTASSSSSSNNTITINNPNPVVTVEQPKVVTQVSAPVKELPKTGLPLAGVAISSLLPVGLKLKRFTSKTSPEQVANFIWEQRGLSK